MRTIILGAAAVALATVPALAQDDNATTTTTRSQPVEPAAPAPQSADEANAQVSPPPATTTVETDAATGAGAVVTIYPGNDTGPPASALDRSYPLCTRKLQDECQNPGEGGAPGHSRALKYWPGRPASEGR